MRLWFQYKALIVALIPASVGLIVMYPIAENWFFADDFYWMYFGLKALESPELIITHTFFNYYRPIVNMIFSLEILWAGLSAIPRHVLNLSIHLATSSLIALWIYRLQKNAVAATISALMFLVSPKSAETVCWISGRIDVLAAFFLMLSIILLPDTSTNVLKKIPSLFFFITAILTKEPAVLAIVIIFFQDRYLLDNVVGRQWIRFRLPWILVSIAGLVLHAVIQLTGRVKFLSFDQSISILNWMQNIIAGTALSILGALPAWFSIDRTGWITVLVLLFICGFKKISMVRSGLIMTALLIIPAAATPFSFLPDTHLTFGRFFYIPLIGSTWIWAALTSKISGFIKHQTIGFLFTMVFILPVIGVSVVSSLETMSEWKAITTSRKLAMAHVQNTLKSLPDNEQVIIVVPDNNEWLEMFYLFSGRPVVAVRSLENIPGDRVVYLFDRGRITRVAAED